MATKRKKSKGKKRKRPPINWEEAQRLYEVEGLSYSAIGERLGCRRETISRRSRREGWVERAEIAHETAAQRRENIFQEFVERDKDAVLANLTRKHQLNARILELAHGHIDRLEAGLDLVIATGQTVVAEDVVMSLRRIALVSQGVEVVDRSLAGLKPNGEGSPGDRSEQDSEADAPAVRAALAELERGEP